MKKMIATIRLRLLGRVVSVLIATVMLATCFTTGCASIIHGTTQNIGFGSNPGGATVTVNGRTVGKTPLVADLKRKDNHLVRIELEGYQPFETTLTRTVSGWIWGNLIFFHGFLPGIVVDAIDGAMYKLTPAQVQAELQELGATSMLTDSGLYLLVTLEPNPEWERIGQLTKN